MKKFSIAVFIMIAAVQIACVSKAEPRSDIDPLIQIYNRSERVTNRDGSIIIARLNFSNGFSLPIKLAPMTKFNSRVPGAEQDYIEHNELIIALSEEIAANPENTAAYIQRAGLFFDRGEPDDFQRVIQDCNTVIEIDKSEQAAYYLRGLASAQLGDFNQAVSDINTVFPGQHGSVEIYYFLGRAYLSMERREQAIEMMENVVKIDPSFADADMVLLELRQR